MDIFSRRVNLTVVAAFAAFVAVFIGCVLWSPTAKSLSFVFDADVEWDLANAQKELEGKVHGQEIAVQQLVDNLQWTQNRNQTSSDGSSIKLLILLGGPGAGKTQAISVIAKNVKCSFRGVLAVFSCDMNVITLPPCSKKFINQQYADSTKFVTYHGTLINTLELDLTAFGDDHAKGFAALEQKIRADSTKKLRRRVFLVSGPIMSNPQHQQGRNTKQYNEHLDAVALSIAKSMKKSASRVDFVIIKFARLPMHHLLKHIEDLGKERFIQGLERIVEEN